MEWWEILILILALFIVVVAGFYYVGIIRYRRVINNTSKVILSVFEDAKIETFHFDDIYQIGFSNHKNYSIKILDMNPGHEVIITNSDKVIINENIKDWKRSTKPNFVNKMTEFIRVNNAEDHVKIVLIYPGCHNITKYINESDVFVLELNQKIDQVYYVKYQDFYDFLKKQ